MLDGYCGKCSNMIGYKFRKRHELLGYAEFILYRNL